MKTIIKNGVHEGKISHECHIVDIKTKKLKITYVCENGSERCTTEIFDGTKWCHFLSLLDMGVMPYSTMYVRSIIERKERAHELITKAINSCKLFLA